MKSWNKQRVLVTGSSGFVGSHLVRRLQQMGVFVYEISRTKGVDVRDMKALEQIFQSNKFTVCYHLAGLAQVEAGQDAPHATFETNIIGALNIFENCRRNHVEKVVVASTSHVYGNNKVPFRETYTPKPTRPYETSKACIDLIGMSYARSFHLPVYIARFVNIYGPGDTNFSRLIPKTIQSVLSGKFPKMWGGSAMRDYLYIDDVIDAYLRLGLIDIEDNEKEYIFNFGSRSLISVKDLISLIIELSKKKLEIDTITNLREHEISVQYVSWAKAKRVLRWKPTVSLRQGLIETLRWYQNAL